MMRLSLKAFLLACLTLGGIGIPLAHHFVRTPTANEIIAKIRPGMSFEQVSQIMPNAPNAEFGSVTMVYYFPIDADHTILVRFAAYDDFGGVEWRVTETPKLLNRRRARDIPTATDTSWDW